MQPSSEKPATAPPVLREQSNVVTLHGHDPLANPSAPDGDVIETLEHLLEEARSGRMIGIAYATNNFDDTGKGTWVGLVTNATLGGLHCVATRMASAMGQDA